VLYLSGYTEQDALVDRLEPDTEFLGKPFTASALLGRVRRLLDRSAPERGRAAGSDARVPGLSELAAAFSSEGDFRSA
jgi:DNA-binding response OmpR family regulator